MNRIRKIASVIPFLFVFAAFSAQPVFADSVFDNAQVNLGGTWLYGGEVTTTRTLPERIGFYLKAVYATLGMVGIILVTWAGFKWITSGGDTKKIESARNQILYTVVGMIVVFSAYMLTTEVINRITDASFNEAAATPAPVAP